MKTLTIGFSKSKKFLPIGSWAIRAYMGTEYSHVYLRFYSESLSRSLIYEAVGKGVRFVGLPIWKQHSEEVKSYDIVVNDESYLKTLQYCVDNAGIEYGYLQNLGVFISDILNLNKNPLDKGKNCSEAVAEMLHLEGYEINKEYNLITPLDIDNILSKGRK
jgi:hypothetical protein